MREFSAAEDEESFHVFYPGEDEPVIVAKYRLDPDVAAQIRSRVVPDDAPGHQSGVFLANAMPEGTPAQEMSVLAQAAQDELAAQYPPTVTTIDPALVSSQPVPVVAGEQSVMEPMSVAPDGFGGQSIQPIESVDPSLDVSMPPAQVYRSLLNTEAAPQSLGGVPQTGAGPFQTQYAGPALSAAGQQAGAASVPPASGSAGVGAGGRLGMGVSVSGRTPGEASVDFKPTPLAVDKNREQIDIDRAVLAGLAGDVEGRKANELAALAAEDAQTQMKMKQDFDAMVQRRALGAEQMRQEIAAGRVDPDRLFTNMDTGRRIGTLIGMVLGGMGKAMAGGDNPVITALNREVDRDIQLQRESIDRKRSVYKDYIDEGKTEVEAFRLSRADALDAMAAKMAATAKRYGSEVAGVNAQAAILKLRADAAADRAAAEASDFGRQLEQFKVVSKAKADEINAKAEQARTQINWYDAKTRRMDVLGKGAGGDKTLQVEITPGQWIQAADPTAREKIAAGRDGHDSFIKGLDQLEALRRKNPGGNVLPAWMAFMGFNSAEQSKIGDSLAGAVQLAFLKANGAGAYDKGSGALASSIIESPANYFGTNDDAFFGKMKELKSLANADYMATIRGRMAPGQAPELFGGSGGFTAKPVGKVQ